MKIAKEWNKMDIINRLNHVLEEVKKGQYGVANIPTKLTGLDMEIGEIVDYYTSSNDCVKEYVHKSITEDMSWQLMCYGIRMATFSLRCSCQKHFDNGLSAIGMTLGKLDLRELLIVLPLYCDVQKKNNLSFDKLLDKKDDLSYFLEEFINRDESNKTLECMGYVLEYDENNVPTYRRTW